MFFLNKEIWDETASRYIRSDWQSRQYLVSPINLVGQHHLKVFCFLFVPIVVDSFSTTCQQLVGALLCFLGLEIRGKNFPVLNIYTYNIHH